MPATHITIHGFLSEFKRRNELMKDRPFCWILGAGASVQSGIPPASKLVQQWLEELHELEDPANTPLEEWATEKNLDIPKFSYKRAANFYPWIYQRRYRKFPDEGYAFLENAMDHAEPSFGYSVLAQLMANTPHKVAVTTNFDNLVADALSIYTRTFPLVCGHESLTGYIRSELRRPLIAKIHRDLLLAPKSNPEQIEALPDEWATALKKIFIRFTPVVIGYGGNDGSLMNFLKSLDPIVGGIFWCHRPSSTLDEKIKEVVDHHDGNFVPIAGFDELMLQLQEKLQLPFLLPEVELFHKKRVESYQKQFESLNEKLKKPAVSQADEAAREPARQAANEALKRLTKEKNWWAWALKAEAEKDSQKAEAVYQEGLNDFPQGAELHAVFANFMIERQKNQDEAERLYRKALELEPDNSRVSGDFANFMMKIRKNHDEVERLYRKSLELNPTSASITCNFAIFMKNVRKNHDEAERLYRKALELDPADAKHICNFAIFMTVVRKNQDEAERLYRKALELDPGDAKITGNFATFMSRARRNQNEAEQLYRKALELDPADATTIGNFATFMTDSLKNQDEAERLYREALELDPDNADIIGNFAIFMTNVRKNQNEAERLFRKAFGFDHDNANITANFSQYLVSQNRLTEATPLVMRAIHLFGNDASQTYAEILLTHWLISGGEERIKYQSLGRLKAVLQHDFVRSSWSFDKMLEIMLPRLQEPDHTLAPKLADAILDPSKLPALESDPLWQTVIPIPLTTPLPDKT